MELREGLPHQAIEQPHRMRPLFASVLMSHDYNRGRHTITKSDLSKPVPCVRKNELHHHSCVKSAKPVWFLASHGRLVPKVWKLKHKHTYIHTCMHAYHAYHAYRTNPTKQPYIHTYIHTYAHTYTYTFTFTYTYIYE